MENKEKNFISAVVYVHNAQERIKKFLETIIAVLENNFEHTEIICVNDYSDDFSVERIKETAQIAKSTNISIINMSYFHGKEVAMNAGLSMAIGDFVYEFDTTMMDYDAAAEIMRIYRKSLEGYDEVGAVAQKHTKISSQIFYKVFNQFSRLPYEMKTESFRILSRRMINRISDMNTSVPYRKAVYANCGLKTINLTYHIIDNEEPQKTDRKERSYRRRLAVDSLLLFTEIGYRLSVAMTVFMILISMFMVGYSLVVYLLRNPIEGWTTTILFLSIAFCGLFGILTVIIKYLQILIDLVFRRKRFSFESIEKLTK